MISKDEWKFRFGALGTAFLLLSLVGCRSEPKPAKILTGLLDAKEIDVASKLPGRVHELLVSEGDSVKKGDLLVRLDLNVLEDRLQAASAVVQATQSQVDLVEAGPRESLTKSAAAAVRAAEKEVESAKRMVERGKRLVEKQAMGQGQLEQLQLAYELANAQLTIAREHEKSLKQGARPEEIATLKSLAQGAVSERDMVRDLLLEEEQRAPIAAEVAAIHVNEGELSGIGFPLLTLVDLDEIWATFAVREDYLKVMQKGSEHTLEVPALGRTVHAAVQYVAPLGDFATWRATSAADSFDLKSFEVRLRILDERVPGLRPGMTVRLKVESP